MKPLPILIVATTVVLLTIPSIHAFTWQPCTPEGAINPPLLTPTAVTLDPDPPQIGASVVFNIQGAVSAAVTSGTIGLRVKFEGVDLYEEEGPLCDKVAAPGCPIGGGGDKAEAKIEYRQDLPPIAPPGHYGVRVIGTTGSSTYDGDTVVCVDVEFDMVMPSSSVKAGAGSGVAAVAAAGEKGQPDGSGGRVAPDARKVVVV